MKRKIFKDSIIYGASNFISGALSFSLLPLYTKNLDASSYGMIDYAGVLQTIIQIIVGLEVTQGIARFAGAGEEKDAREFQQTGLTFAVLSSSILFALSWIARPFLEMNWQWNAAQLGIYQLAVSFVLLKSLFYFFSTQLRWDLRPRAYLIASIGTSGLSFALTACLFIWYEKSISSALMALVIANAVGIALCIAQFRFRMRLVIDKKKLQKLLRYSSPLVISSFALFLGNYADRLLLQHFLGFQELGVYAVAARFGSIMALGLAGFSLSATPLIFKAQNQATLPKDLAAMIRYFLFMGLSASIVLSTFAPELVKLLTTSAYEDAFALIPMLTAGVVLNSVYIFTPGLILKDQTFRFALIGTATAAVSLLLNIFLIPIYGKFGAAMSFFGTSLSALGLQMAFSQRVLPLPLAHFRLLAAIVVQSLFISAFSSIYTLTAFKRLVVAIFLVASLALILLKTDEILTKRHRA